MHNVIDAVLTYPFMQLALVAGVLASLASGIVGTVVVVRRSSYIAGSISHFVLGGMGVARYMNVVHGVAWATPWLGAILSSLLAALLIGLVTEKAREREDTIIGAIWAVGMAVGVLFIAATPGYNADIMTYLFGNILMVAPSDIIALAVLDAAVLAAVLLYHRVIGAVCFDEEFARVRGLPVSFITVLMLGVIAVTVVMLISVVGVVLVIALITLPAATAGRLSGSLIQMMSVATVAALLSVIVGLAVSYAPNLPAGASIVVVAGVLYLFTLAATGVRRKVRQKKAGTIA